MMDGNEVYTKLNCGECGIFFFVPAAFDNERRQHKEAHFVCPNGHQRCYKETLADQLGKKCDELRDRLTVSEKSLLAAERKVSRLEKKARRK